MYNVRVWILFFSKYLVVLLCIVLVFVSPCMREEGMRDHI